MRIQELRTYGNQDKLAREAIRRFICYESKQQIKWCWQFVLFIYLCCDVWSARGKKLNGFKIPKRRVRCSTT